MEPSALHFSAEFRDAAMPAETSSSPSNPTLAVPHQHQNEAMRSNTSSTSTKHPLLRSRSTVDPSGTSQGFSPIDSPTDVSTIGACEDQSCCPNGFSQRIGNFRGNFMVGFRNDQCLVGLGGGDIMVQHWRSPAARTAMIGGTGPDLLWASKAEEAFLHGGSGHDFVYGSKGNDSIYGGPGRDVLYGRGGNDEMYGGGASVDEQDLRNTMYGGEGNDRMFAGGGGDRLYGQMGDDILVAGGGVDHLRGGPGNDTIFPTDGADQVFGDDGDDRFIFTNGCAIASGMLIDGGPGYDIVESTLNEEQLAQRGVTLTDIEELKVVPEHLCHGQGICVVDEQGADACACTAPWGGESCEDCGPDKHFANGLKHAKTLQELYDEAYDPSIDSKLDAYGVSCQADVHCDQLTCGDHGTCIEDESFAHCACDVGFSGPHCDECAPLWEADGNTCTLGQSCRETFCRGQGDCKVADGQEPGQEFGQGRLACECDAGYSGHDCRHGGPEITVPQAAVPEQGSVVLEMLGLPAQCGDAIHWSVISGPGSVESLGGSELRHHRARFSVGELHLNPGQFVDSTIVQAQSVGCPNESARVVVASRKGDSLPVFGVGPQAFQWLDDLFVDVLSTHNLLGASVAVTHAGSVVYARSFGHADESRSTPVQPANLMRIASCSKPVAAAALREVLSADPVLTIGATLFGDVRFEHPPEFTVVTGVQGDGTFGRLPNGDPIRKVPRAAQVWTPPISGSFTQADIDARQDDCFNLNISDLTMPDPLWDSLTLEDLIRHRTGLDKDVWIDFTHNNRFISDHEFFGHAPPAATEDIRHLTFRLCPVVPPGMRSPENGYANAGYITIGGLVGELSKANNLGPEDFFTYAKSSVLHSYDDFLPGKTKKDALHHREVEYAGSGTSYDVFRAVCISGAADEDCLPGDWDYPEQERHQYGGNFTLEPRLASGGFITSACQLAEFQTHRQGNGLPWTGGSGSISGGLPGTSAMSLWVPAATGRQPMTVTYILNQRISSIQVQDAMGNDIPLSTSINQSIRASIDAMTKVPTASTTCGVCGDGVISADEICDPAASPMFLNGDSCITRGYDLGQLKCVDCQAIDASLCRDRSNPDVPPSYADCGASACTSPELCDELPGAGTCLGGPCQRATVEFNHTLSHNDELDFTNESASFHPDGDFRTGDGSFSSPHDYYFCKDDTSHGPMTCVNENGWGVCKKTTGFDSALETPLGAACQDTSGCAGLNDGTALACYGGGAAATGGQGQCLRWPNLAPWMCESGHCGAIPIAPATAQLHCSHIENTGGASCINGDDCLAPDQFYECAIGGKLCNPDWKPDDSSSEKCMAMCNTDADCDHATYGWPEGYRCLQFTCRPG